LKAELYVDHFQRAARGSGQIANDTVGDLAGNRQLAFALKFFEPHARIGVDNSLALI